MKAIMSYVYPRELHQHHCVLLYANNLLLLLTFVKRCGHIAKQYPLSEIHIS